MNQADMDYVPEPAPIVHAPGVRLGRWYGRCYQCPAESRHGTWSAPTEAECNEMAVEHIRKMHP